MARKDLFLKFVLFIRCYILKVRMQKMEHKIEIVIRYISHIPIQETS